MASARAESVFGFQLCLDENRMLQVLHVDDEKSFLESAKQILKMKGNFEVETSTSVDEALERIREKSFDVIISDYRMPEKDGLEFLRELRKNGYRIPFIIFTGKGREEVAIKALNLGADQYISKMGDVETVYGELSHAIKKAAKIRQEEKALHESEEKYRTLVEQSLQGVVAIQDFSIVFANQAFSNISGYTIQELHNLNPYEVKAMVHPGDQPLVWSRFKDRLNGKQVSSHYEFRVVRKDGTIRWLEMSATRIIYQGRPAVQGTFVDITERKEMEEALRDSEEKFRLAFENAKDAIFWADPRSGLIINCNKAAEVLLERSKAEIIGKHQTHLHPTEKVKTYASMFKKHIRQNGVVDDEADVIAKSGEIKHVHITASVTQLGGKPVIQGIFRDMTTRRLREKVAHREQMTFVELFRRNPEAAAYVDVNFRIVDVNPRFEQLFGHCLNQIRGKLINDVVVPDEKIAEAEMLDKESAKGYVYHDTVRKTKTGALIPVSISAAPITIEGQLVGHVALYKDISDRTKAEQQLIAAQKHFEALFDLMVDPVTVVDKKGKILEVSQKVEEMTGFKKKELIGKNFLRIPIVTKKSKATMLKNLAKRMMGEKLVPYEIEVLTKGGQKLPYEINAAKIKFKGQPADLVVFRDISERKKMEEKLRVVGRLTRHDVRNKLSTILGNTYLIKNDFSDHNKISEYLEYIESAVDQTKEIFEFARDYERLGIEEQTYLDLGKTFEEASSLLPNLEGVKITNECHGLKLLADSLLRQFFYNLIDNSLKHGGKISEIRFFFERGKDELRIVYSDDGVGIPKNEKKKIFLEGYGKGTGYGLYLIRKICDVYGWSIQETNRFNKGAQFTIAIPSMNSHLQENFKFN
ncbi:MAG: PAS domain S-box protein [Candidatus Bathyarchaeota archaeon]|nr:MAG: PAS domain S-box protein [Candidatus Bathyarchaeota archaeon]